MNPHLTEGDQVPVDLTPIWLETNTRYRALTVSKPGYRCIRWLIEHILDAGYSKGLFPGTSMYSLLMSLPTDGKVDYSNTLRVGYDELTQVAEFKLKLNKDIVWETTCRPTEIIDTLEHFLNEHPDWSGAARREHLVWLRFNDPKTNIEPERKGLTDLLLAGIGNALTLIIPQQNPDFDRLIDNVAYWMIEYDKTGDETIRELGFDQHDNVILAMPLDRNYGYWTDNQLKLSDYDRFNPIPLTEKEFDTAWLKFTSEWKRH
jgi:hypothetical protein